MIQEGGIAFRRTAGTFKCQAEGAHGSFLRGGAGSGVDGGPARETHKTQLGGSGLGVDMSAAGKLKIKLTRLRNESMKKVLQVMS